MKKTKFALSAIALLFAGNALAADGKLVEINYTDEEGYGFYSVEPFSVEGNPAKTLGEARRNALEHSVSVISTQFYAKQSFIWDVGFSEDASVIVNTLSFVGAKENMENSNDEEKFPAHYFLNPVSQDDEHLNERNIYTTAFYLAHADQSSNSNEAAITSVIPMDYRFNLDDIESEESLFRFVQGSLVNAMGFSITNNYNKEIIDNPSETSNQKSDKELEFHHSYFNKFLTESTDEDSEILYGKDFQFVANAASKGVYFNHSLLSEDTLEYIEYHALLTSGDNYSIPMIYNGNYGEDDGLGEEEVDCYEDPENPGDPRDSNGEPCEMPVEEEEDLSYQNIDLVFTDNLISDIKDKDTIKVNGLNLSAHILCDIGWCQTSSTSEDDMFTGKVIDLSVGLISEDNTFNINANKSADLQFSISSVDAGYYPLSKVVFETTMSGDIAIDKMNDQLLNSDACEISSIETEGEVETDEEAKPDHLITCKFDELTESKEFWLRMKSPEGGDYVISSKVYSNASNVDIDGTNNINHQELSFIPHDKDADESGDVEDGEDESGGSFGLISLLLLPLAILRRRKK